MAKGIIRTAADAVKTVASAAIGAAAAAATTVVVESVANSIKGNKKMYEAPAVEDAVRLAIAAPSRPAERRKPRAKSAAVAKSVKKKTAAKGAALKKKKQNSSAKRR